MWFRLLHHISRDLVHMAAFIQRHNWRSYTCQLTSTLMSVRMSIVPWFVTSSLLKIYSYSLLWLQWPIPEPPEPPGLIKRYPALVMERGPPLQAATVLQRRLVPSGTDIRSLLAWFYDTMSYLIPQASVYDISSPLSLINTNEVYVVNTPNMRKVVFVDPFLSGYESRPWEIKKSFHPVEVIIMDKWTRYDSRCRCNLAVTMENRLQRAF